MLASGGRSRRPDCRAAIAAAPDRSAAIAALFFAFGLIMPNFNAIAMQPMGAVAGTASSFVGFYTTAAGALLGWGIGGFFDGTIQPLATGFAVLSVAAFLTVLAVEGPRNLFRGE